MRFSIDVDYPVENFEVNRRRIEARSRFQYADRVPVSFCLEPRYFAPRFGLRYIDFFKDASTHYNWQLQFLKYRMENIPEDIWTEPTIRVAPYFDNVLDSDSFGAQTIWPENETLQTVPTIRTVEQMDSFEVPPETSGLWGKAVDWWTKMKEFVRETRVTFNGKEGTADVGVLGINGLDPHMIAIDLVGHDFYWWMVDCPDKCHRFLEKITQGLIRQQRYFMKIDPRPRGGIWLAGDTSTILSPKMFKEFCVPYDKFLYDTFGNGLTNPARSMHMCGNSTHLHSVLVNDLKISSFDVFGYQVPPKIASENLGGKMYLWGNINPMLMLSGTKAKVKEKAMECLEALAPCGGFMLGDGANICPGTPLENLAVVTQASEEYGLPTVRNRTL
jgi:hypothetical protein